MKRLALLKQSNLVRDAKPILPKEYPHLHVFLQSNGLKLAYNTIEDWSNRGHVCRVGKLGKITVSTNFVSNEKKIEDQVKT